MTEDLAVALAHHRAGRLAEAEEIYRRILERNPRQPDLLHLLGGIAYQSGDCETAVARYDAAIAAAPSAVNDTLLYNRGNALKALGRRSEAIAAFRKALQLNPSNGTAYYNLGLLLHEAGDLVEADTAYRMALALRPDHAAAWNNLGVLMHEQGRMLDAEAALRLALQQEPEFPDGLFNLARLFWHTDRAAAAEETIRQLLANTPDHGGAYRVLGDSLQTQGRLAEAVEAYRQCIALEPDTVAAHVNLGIALGALERVAEAEASLRKAIELKGDDATAHRALAVLVQRTGRPTEAIQAYRTALALNPDDDEARVGLCIAQLPVIAESQAAAAAARTAYEVQLRALLTMFDQASTERRAAAAAAIGRVQPFYLAYQGENDRDLQAEYGTLCWKLMSARYPTWSIPPSPRRRLAQERIRVGFVSGFFNWHSVWTIPLRGWVEHLNRDRFSVHCYYTQALEGPATTTARGLADLFVDGPLSVEGWAERILQDNNDVLIYPELGMDPTSAQLATLRLAPVQCTAIGHPQTTGLPTMDFFLSSTLMEPEDGDAHYTERLVRLPNLGVYYLPPVEDREPMTREDFGLPSDRVLYWCCQSLFKYQPHADEVFVRIARAVPDALFVFIEAPYPAITDAFRQRLERAFAAAGLDAGRFVRFIRRLSVAEFATMAALSDVYLDSVGWSGFNTTLESLYWGLPVVTLPGKLMRSRHSWGVLAMLGETETIARDLDQYVEIGAGLGSDPIRRAEISGRLLAKRDRLLRDRSAVTGLEAFLESAVGPARG